MGVECGDGCYVWCDLYFDVSELDRHNGSKGLCVPADLPLLASISDLHTLGCRGVCFRFVLRSRLSGGKG